MMQYNPKPGIIDWLWRIRRGLERRWRHVSSLFKLRVYENPGPKKDTLAKTRSVAKDELQPGDLVRVKSREEIQASLDSRGQLRGYLFMEEMWQYCGTSHRVRNRVRQFLDERDYRMKKLKRTVLLEDAICEGTQWYGPCDRACYYFWREEWLEKVE